jgi:hypothetical protein
MGLTVGLVVNSVNVCSTNVMCAVVKCVDREVQVQYEIQGQNMCIDEMIVFLVFLLCSGQMFITVEECTASIFRATGLHQVNVEVMWRKEMCW